MRAVPPVESAVKSIKIRFTVTDPEGVSYFKSMEYPVGQGLTLEQWQPLTDWLMERLVPWMK